MNLLASRVIDNVRNTLNDQIITGQSPTWSDASLLRYVDLAQLQISNLKRNSLIAEDDLSLVAGAKQALPDDGAYLLDITYNVPSMSAITVAERRELDRTVPTWRSAVSHDGTITNFMYQKETPDIFWVYPQATAGQQVHALYGKIPTAVSALTQTLDISSGYLNALVFYTLGLAFLEDNQANQPKQLAQVFFTEFYETLQLRRVNEVTYSPNILAAAKEPDAI